MEDQNTTPEVKTIEEELDMTTEDKNFLFSVLDEVRENKITNEEALRKVAKYAEGEVR